MSQKPCDKFPAPRPERSKSQKKKAAKRRARIAMAEWEGDPKDYTPGKLPPIKLGRRYKYQPLPKHGQMAIGRLGK